ncbi:MAG: DUF3147 family protein [Syntrophobacteraceae bacterium]
MQRFIVKILITTVIISGAAETAKRLPSLGGLIATMPLTSLIVLMWIYADEPGNHGALLGYARGALWGMLPTALFFLAAYLCFRMRLSLAVALSVGFGVWLLGALLHQWLLEGLAR